MDVIDWCGIATDVVKEKLKDAKIQKRIQDNLKRYIDEERARNESCPREEEIDFEGIAGYIGGELLADAQRCLYEDPAARQAAEHTIYAKAADGYSGPAACRVHKMVGQALEIIRDTLMEQTPKEERLLHQQTADIIIDAVEKKGDEIVERLAGNQPPREVPDSLDTYINRQRDQVRSMAIFPWFNESRRYQEVFPQLFVPPVLLMREEPYQLQRLLGDKEENIAVLGEAGAGKSTLLRHLFAFPAPDMDMGRCIYLTARDTVRPADRPLLDQVLRSVDAEGTHLLIFIDGIDEQFHDDYRGFVGLLNKLKAAGNCHFWLGCRTDFYQRSYGENTAFTARDYTLRPWSDGTDGQEDQIGYFIKTYGEITGKPDLAEKVDRLLSRDSDPLRFKSNPFQLALLAFLAEREERSPIRGIYDLYERFVKEWLDKEQRRETCRSEKKEIVKMLQEAASRIYDAEMFPLSEEAEENTAVTDLLIIEEVGACGQRCGTAFYHRSLAAFFLAQAAVEAMLENDVRQMERSFSHKLKDDVTNFVGDKIATLSPGEKRTISENLRALYCGIGEDEGKLSVKEQAIYFITRLGIDVSDFLVRIVRENPEHPIMRLTLAYGCVLSDEVEARDFALSYARSIAEESQDAVTNRAWTVIYFGDVNDRDPYTYQDDEKGDWSRARAARIKRFTKKNPRPKDYRFRLFDIPLFHSFLKDRGWDGLSREEYDILCRVDFPEKEFRREEIEFLTRQKELLLAEYARRLDGNSTEAAPDRQSECP